MSRPEVVRDPCIDRSRSEDKDWDFGTGAGFYLTATSDAYKKNYNMYDHILREIPEALEKADLGIVSALSLHTYPW